LKEAVADLDAAPASAPSFRAAAAATASGLPPAPAEEPPRRRSTVREPAPIGGMRKPRRRRRQPASPAPQPVITEVGDDESTDRPRRSGWWSRRFAGG
jgi:ribonuclease E